MNDDEDEAVLRRLLRRPTGDRERAVRAFRDVVERWAALPEEEQSGEGAARLPSLKQELERLRRRAESEDWSAALHSDLESLEGVLNG